LDQALDLAREAGDRRLRTTVFDRRGTVLASTGRHAAARRNYLDALAEVEGTEDHRAHGAVIANLGRLARLAGDAGGAAHLLRRALAVLARAGDAEGEAFTGLELARALRALGRPAEAERELARAIERVESARAGLPSTTSRSAFLSHRREIYDELIDLLMVRAASDPEGGHHLAALAVAERSHARSLVDSISAAGDPPASGETRRAVMAEVAGLDLERARLRGRDAPRERLATLERRLGRLTRLAERLAGPPAQPAGRLLTAAGLASVLDADTDLLVFSLGAVRSYAWLVDAGGAVEWFALPAAATLEGFARRTASELARRRRDSLPLPSGGASAALADRLLADIAPRLDVRRLAVVPDGALHLVPFQALPVPGGAGDLLLDRVEVVVVPSPSALARQRARPVAPRPAGVLVVADPVFSATDPRAGGELVLAAASLPADLERSMTDLDLARLPRLRWTRREARSIVAAARPGRSRLLVDFAADRRRLLAGDLARHRVLHFATHSLLHPDDPQLSGIVLSLVGPDGGSRDGFLRAWEISALDLPVELAVLSACSTALGREVRAEGLIGLPQAFFRAGVRRVVVSHWPVHDRATAELMAVFYDGLLRRGLGPAAALAEAQRA
ncbi:MAG TPA: CHAT domain-containing tetratricopeptide repeat protein, partial [Thermoanaerobaculia bacterium]|nr:CHAT domain-containing tetratricopeptide repeat protein [Thermoanaerobaculia bacterium]